MGKALVVRQSNHLIEAQYKLSLVEKRFVLYLTALVTQDDDDFRWYDVDLEAMAQAFPTAHKDLLGQFERVADGLMKKVLHVVDAETSVRKKFQWLAGAEFDAANKAVRVSFHPDLKPYLLKLKSFFTSFAISNVSNLHSAYSIRLYELLKQYEKIGKRTFRVDELQAALGSEYPRYPNFKQRVLAPSVAEISDNTDIQCSFVEEKKGRKVLAVRFTISANARTRAEERARSAAASGEGDGATRALLSDRFGFSDAEAGKILEEHSAAYVREVLEVVEARVRDAAATGNPVINVTAYARKAIEADWRPKAGSLAVEAAALEKKREAAEAERRAKEAAERDKARRDQEARDAAWARYEAQPEDVRRALRDAFEADLATGRTPGGEFILNQWRAGGLSNVGAKASFRAWLARRVS
jgi:plasmid replication initiation protein